MKKNARTDNDWFNDNDVCFTTLTKKKINLHFVVFFNPM